MPNFVFGNLGRESTSEIKTFIISSGLTRIDTDKEYSPKKSAVVRCKNKKNLKDNDKRFDFFQGALGATAYLGNAAGALAGRQGADV